MRRIVLFGDSVFAGQGLDPHQTIAAQLASLLPFDRVIAAGIPDQTAADGLARSATIDCDLALVEFGLNDAFTGTPVAITEDALGGLVRDLQARGTDVLLIEALVPPTSIWPGLVDQRGMAERVASAHCIAFVPDILAPCAGHRLADGLHPDPDGAGIVARMLAEHLG